MRRVSFLLCALVLLVSGCSPAIRDWSERGTSGLANERDNITAWYELVTAGIEKDKQTLVASTYADLRLGIGGGIKRPDGTVVEVDEGWLLIQQKVLSASLKALDARQRQVNEMYATNMKDVDRTQEAFEQIQRLNNVYAGNKDEIAAQVSKLTALVESLVKRKE